jgi:hypothetical protein
MSFEIFQEYKFHAKSMELISQANEIIESYQAQGFQLTLRQLYYQFVARGLLANQQRNYKSLGALLSKARLAGHVDWDAIEDRTRNLKGWSGGYNDVPDYIDGIADGYFVDIWQGQENYLEVWVEKDALIGVVEKSCNAFRIPYFACRGYSSQSEQFGAGKRFYNEYSSGKACHVFHLGDHDPSGIDMTRDNADRLAMFSYENVEVHRIALNMDQIEELNPPPNPAKETDSRSGEYKRRFGNKSWELDALDPNYIDRLIRRSVEPYIDGEKMQARRSLEREGQDELRLISNNYDAIKDYLSERDI